MRVCEWERERERETSAERRRRERGEESSVSPGALGSLVAGCCAVAVVAWLVAPGGELHHTGARSPTLSPAQFGAAMGLSPGFTVLIILPAFLLHTSGLYIASSVGTYSQTWSVFMLFFYLFSHLSLFNHCTAWRSLGSLLEAPRPVSLSAFLLCLSVFASAFGDAFATSVRPQEVPQRCKECCDLLSPPLSVI